MPRRRSRAQIRSSESPCRTSRPRYRLVHTCEVYEKNCLLCHSARYVLTQPRFSKAQWQAEVKKMGDAYGASISPEDQALIVEYLVAVKGSDPPASVPAK